MEKVAVDLGAYVRHAREVLGYRRVVLVGWSGGGSLSLFYQSEALAPSVTETPAGDPVDLASAGLQPADAPDHDLVTALRSGDPRAFETLVRRYGGRMLATARRMMVVEDDAHDVVQEAFLSAFRSIESFAGTARLSTWLHRIVVNAALMKLRSRRRRPEESIDALLPRFDDSGHFAEPVARWEGGGVARLERQETRLAVRAAIDRLPDNYRTVLLLRDIEELDTEETAARLALTPSIVKMRLHRARQALRALISRDFEQEIPPADGGGRLRRRASAVA
jgi:RNA polymerase sigma-70 factor (ECF subfamily)